MKTRRCTKCGCYKWFTEFRKDKRCFFGVAYDCLSCRKEYGKSIAKPLSAEQKKIRNEKRRQIRQETPQVTWAYSTISYHKKSYIVDFDVYYLVDLAKNTSHCALCGTPLNWNYYRTLQHNSPSLDRINNETHLDESNIQIICSKCNTTKSNRTQQEFIEYCHLIASKFPISNKHISSDSPTQ